MGTRGMSRCPLVIYSVHHAHFRTGQPQHWSSKMTVALGRFNMSMWSFQNTAILAWFLEPHPLWHHTYLHSLDGLMPNANATRTFIPPFELLLTGDNETCATCCRITALIHLYIYLQQDLAQHDPSVCPLSKQH